MIKCDKGTLTVEGNSSEIGVEGVAILAFLYQKRVLVACLKTLADMLHDGTIDKVFEDEED